MTRQLALSALSRLSDSAMLVDAASLPHVSTALQQLAMADKVQEQASYTERMDQICQAYGYKESVRDKPFVFANGIAVIPVHGTLLNRFNYSWSFVTGYNFIRWQMNAALDDEDVEMIVFDIHSPGGEAAGCFELADEIREARSQKSLLAVVDSMAASAAYAIASACSKVYLTPSGRAGSIGVIATHMDWSEALAKDGIKVTLIYSGKHKADGNPYEALPDDVKADVQASVDNARGQFVELVARNRSLDSETIRDTEAKVYRADEALEVGLVDAVKTPTEAVAAFLGELGGDNPAETKDETMTTPAGTAPLAATPAAAAAPVVDQAAINAAVSAALSADRTRQAGITGSDEAKGREDLASHLALTTDMSVEAAVAVLAKAPKAAAASTAAAGTNALDAAMAGTEQPNVGADGAGAQGGPGGEAASPVNSILADHAAATGRQPLKA